MKKLILLGLTVILFASCKQTEQRYFDESAEIDTVKQLYQLVEEGNYDEARTFYNDTAKVFVNSSKAVSPDEMTAANKKGRADFTMFTFKDSIYPEMVITKSGSTWVNTWPTWVGKVKGSDTEITLPLHLSFQFKDGKIVRYEGFWDNLPIYLEREKIKASMNEASETSNEESEASKK
jgi:ketosteroid isomerase-like protein